MLRRHQASAPFSPIDIAGISLWLKADAGVTVSGGFVTAWSDQSGNGNNCSSPNNVEFSSSPYPNLYFGGIDTESEITLHPNIFNGYSALSLFAVWNIEQGDNNGIIGSNNYSNFEITVNVDGDTEQYSSFVRMRNNNYASSINIGGWWFFEEFSLSSLAIDAANENGTMRRNGSTSGVNFDAENAQALQLGQTYKIGRYAEDGGDFFAIFRLAELIVYSGKLNGSQIDQVEGYLNDKYAIY